MANRTLFGKEGRDALMVGIKTVHDATVMSLGASGRNAIFRLYGRPKITNDGVRIARNIDPEDEFEKLGADLIKEASEKTDTDAGDGTTTAMALAYAIIDGGAKHIEKGTNSMRLRNEIDEATKHIVKILESTSTKIKSLADLEHVAIVSVENEELGKTIAGAAMRAGVDGSVIIEEHEKPTIERNDVEGYRFDRGLTSPYLVTNPDKMEAVVENCPVLVTDKTWNLNSDLIPLVEDLHKNGHRSIVIIAEAIEGELLATLVKNSMSGLFRTIIVKKPANADMLEDIATITGATAMTNSKGIVKAHMAYFGWADKVISTQNHTTIIGGRAEKAEVDKRLSELKELIPTLEGYEKNKAKERLARLTCGVSIISIGAPTIAERSYLKLKADDAVNACRCALEDGIIPGGGVALRDIAQDILFKASDKVSQGQMAVLEACATPFKLIAESAGEPIGDRVWSHGEGVDAKTGKSVDMIKAGIIDPVKVTRSALINAASFAGIFLTTEAFTAEIPKQANEGGYS